MRIILFLIVLLIMGCNNPNPNNENQMEKKGNIVFLHHSTGKNIWRGSTSKIAYKIFKKGDVNKWFANYNKVNGTEYTVAETYFPNNTGGYGWKNYPYDYYNIWIKNAGEKDFMNEPTLEILTKKYNVIIWKHCYPVCDILPDTGQPDIDSEEKKAENYKLQYTALKEKMMAFPNTKFIVWTGAALTEKRTTPEKAQRAKDFFNWVKEEWDTPGDNIFIWDFYELETEGGLYIKNEYASGIDDPHPAKGFSQKVAPLFCKRIVDVIEGRGDIASISGL
jgi:hypothetical protein